MGIFEGEEEVLAFTCNNYYLACWVANSILKRVGGSAFYLYVVLGDAGGALGAALSAYHMYFDRPRIKSGQMDNMQWAYLGPEYTGLDIERQLNIRIRMRDTGNSFRHLSRRQDMV